MIAIGGWNEGSTKYSGMAKDKKKRQKFVNSTLDFLQKHNFDGIYYADFLHQKNISSNLKNEKAFNSNSNTSL